MTPRKVKREIPRFEGWEFRDGITNLTMPCEGCGAKVHEFFYRHVREPGSDILVTKVKCGPCAGLHVNERKAG